MKPHILPHVKVFWPFNSERNVFHNKYRLPKIVFWGWVFHFTQKKALEMRLLGKNLLSLLPGFV